MEWKEKIPLGRQDLQDEQDNTRLADIMLSPQRHGEHRAVFSFYPIGQTPVK